MPNFQLWHHVTCSTEERDNKLMCFINIDYISEDIFIILLKVNIYQYISLTTSSLMTSHEKLISNALGLCFIKYRSTHRAG